MSVCLRALGERPLGLALGIGFVALAVAYQSHRPLTVNIGQGFDDPYTPGFYAPEQSGQASFRWSGAHSTLVFPGIGKPLSPFPVLLQLSSGRGHDSAPLKVGVAVNGHPVPALSLSPESASYTVTVDPAWVDASSDLRLDFTSPTFKAAGDRRDLGFIADFARVVLPTSLMLPAVPQIAWLLLSAVLLFLMLRVVWVTPRASALLVLLFLLACAGVIGVQRLLLTIYTVQLVVTFGLALLVGLLGEVLTRWVVWVAGWRGASSLPEWAWAGLRGLVIAAVALKVGGLLYPGSFIIDAPFHLKYITYMSEFFAGGRSWEQYFGKSLSFAVMPKEEWGSARAFIPYSPFFYVVAAPLAWLPISLSQSVAVATGILDALKTPLVFIIGLAFSSGRSGLYSVREEAPAGRAARTALVAAAVYSAIPATFLLQQWGNWPTQLSLWLVTLWVAITCLFWTRFTRPAVWSASTAALTLAMLSYTVSAVYTGLFVGMLVVGGWIAAPAERKRWAALLLSAFVATLLSLLIYYGHYIGDVLQETFPTFGKAIQEQGKLTTLRPTVWDFLVTHLGGAMQAYDLSIIYALALAGALWVFLRGKELVYRTDKSTGKNGRDKSYGIIAPEMAARRPWNFAGRRAVPWQHIWIGAWLLTFPLFTAADFWVDQALKEFWYALPAIALVAGVWLLALLARARGSHPYTALVWLLGATLAWQSLSLWVFRLLFHNR